MAVTLVLASRSPRRQELLRQIDVAFEAFPVDIPEVPAASETPAQYVARVARDKARAAWQRLGEPADTWVLGADTEVVIDGEALGKPADDAQAAAMLARLAGRSHTVVSRLFVMNGRQEYATGCDSRVSFGPLDETRIAAYVATGEPRGKAGAYAIQGRGAAFVQRLDGSYSGVMGLPLYETAELLRRCGLA